MNRLSPVPLRVTYRVARIAFEAPPRARVREGSAAQEVKEEPEDTLQPRPDEVEMVRTLRRYGVTTPDAVYSLRECGHRVEVALQLALDTAKTRDENKAMDDARLESEKEKDRAAERQSLEDKALKVLGEVTSHFPKVRFDPFSFLKPCAGRGGHSVRAACFPDRGGKRQVSPRANFPGFCVRTIPCSPTVASPERREWLCDFSTACGEAFRGRWNMHPGVVRVSREGYNPAFS